MRCACFGDTVYLVSLVSIVVSVRCIGDVSVCSASGVLGVCWCFSMRCVLVTVVSVVLVMFLVSIDVQFVR